MKEIVEIATLAFPDESERWHKEVAKGLCKAHKKVFECIMDNVEQAVEEDKLFIVLPVQEIDDIARSCVKHSGAWHWAITNTREYTVKNMERFGYKVEIKDIFADDSYVSSIILEWERGKHNDYSKES